MDEGIISQVSRNVAESGVYKFQTAPKEFVSAGFVTTSYPATLPVSLSFLLFGSGLLQARIVMVLFILALFLAIYCLARKHFEDRWTVYLTLILMSTFAPLYGHGKNVLGEIPGLLSLVIALFFILKIERDSRSTRDFVLAGLFFGLAFVTKPIFILLGPALLFLLFKWRKKGNPKQLVMAVIIFLVPIVAWIFIQFSGDTVSNMLGIYSNPHHTVVSSAIRDNLLRLFTEAQPMYFLILMAIWYVSLLVRYLRKQPITIVEQAAAIFSCFVFLAYFRTIGYYRYFFLAQFFALFYCASSVMHIFSAKIPKKFLYSALGLLVVLQLYQTFFNSWVAIHFKSRGTEELTEIMATLPKDSAYYIYQVPEVVLFLPNNNYYQYLRVTEDIEIGYNTLNLLTEGKVPFVITNDESVQNHPELFLKYTKRKSTDRYIFLEKK